MSKLFRALEADDLEVKVEEINSVNGGATLVLYKNAIIDSILLDEMFPNKWQVTHDVTFRNDGSELVTATIEIYSEETKSFLKYNDVGSPMISSDATKTAFTDALKRAGFVCGIGRELKNKMPKIVFPISKMANTWEIEKNETNIVYGSNDKFEVVDIVYENKEMPNRRIIGLTIMDLSSGQTEEYDFTRKSAEVKETTKKTQTKKTTSAKNTKKDNKANATTPTVTAPVETKEEPVSDAFMQISADEPEEVDFDKATEPVVEAKVEKVEEAPVSTPAPQPQQVSTPPYDEADPGSCFVNVGKFKSQGSRLRDLTVQQVRMVYLSPMADDRLKNAIKLYAVGNEPLINEFIARGINILKAA